MIERTTDYKINNTKFRVTYGDITRLTADALVSSDDNYLTMGGGVSASLLKAGGASISKEARKHIPLGLGDVAVTSAGRLSAKYIFHVVTIDYTNMIYVSEKNIEAASLRCMELADMLGVRIIAFPALGTGVANFPFQLAAEIMTQTIASYLLGGTSIELVILTLYAREAVSKNDLRIFYERAVGVASVFMQSKRLNRLLVEMEKIVTQMNQPLLSKRIVELQTELSRAQTSLLEKPEDMDIISDISKQVIDVSTSTQASIVWSDKQLESEVLRTKRDGLLTQLNIQTSHLNKFQIEKAKYGGQLVPPRLEFAITDMEAEIIKTQEQIENVRKQLLQRGVK
jgi:O-acetyl-ADP-ribose deacetylase (regulator of RNase III)